MWLKTLYRKRAVTWPFIFYTIIWTLSEEQPLKLGMMLCKHYNCYDINEVLKKANLNQFCEQKSLSHYDQNYGRNYDQK
ncbi:hypothetical protein DVW61_11905 [Enterococcus faecium]|uniref:hypothetical protein n=1 Tax=Enterococcus faecium TaxID=1352 RepID=UPI00113E225F|nr:hypothetical protein [Enterococcus faecium]TKM58006.1 hypothetical protein DVW61_11905 [Enterococcus faecium]